MEWFAETARDYWVLFGFGLITSAFAAGYRKMSKKLAKEMSNYENVKSGVQALLRSDLIRTYNYYHERGFFPIYAREGFDKEYGSYHALDGNGVIEDLKKDLYNLPTEKPKKSGEQT